ncbi:MAG: aminotransferase class V-fold PLP-dependent enzyme [Gemmatimonadetes bacterium]|nr:aminotransferase class V-fold PLP-dependent enzyme [Gemmatimonadota bacterium]
MDEDIREDKRVDGPDSAEVENGLVWPDRLDRFNRRTFIRVSALAGMAGAAGVAAVGCRSASESDGSAGDGGAGDTGGVGSSGGTGGDPEALAAGLRDNVYTRLLGVRPHVGAHEHLSSMGGSRMPAEVVEAMAEANRYFVDMAELHDAAGRRIAEIMGAEAALVSSGAFAAMLVGAAGVLTGSDQDRMRMLPNPTWPKVECLFQTAHRFFYDNVFGFAGMKLVEAGARAEYEAAITERTALLVGLAYIEHQTRGVPPFPVRHRQEHDPETLMPLEIIEIGKRRGVPVMIDLASNLPPKENLTKYLEAGADLVVVSGGKGIRGPNSTGILAGRADLIQAARVQNAPVNGIGRGLKVGKEEIVGLVAALERYVALDEEAEIAAWNAKARRLADQLQGIDGLEARYELNTHGYCDVELVWDESAVPLSADDVDRLLRAGDPKIIYDGPGPRTLQLEDGEVELVARRLRELFTTGS